MIRRLGNVVGLDRAVAYTLSSRALNIVSSTGTVLLIVHFLSAAEQGYYYTLLSLVSLQMVFELGFSFVILQLAAHESAHLRIAMDGTIEGDPRALSRLASVLQLTVRWYLRAAAALALVLIPAGFGFFSIKHPGEAHVAWHGPVLLAVLAVSGSFLITPLFSFFEGCNQVREVAFARMCQAAATLVASWGAIVSGHGLYAAAFVNLSVVLVGLAFLVRRRHIAGRLLRYPVTEDRVRWGAEVWPFQWKIAVSWLSSYLTLQIFTPLLFLFRGPSEAGRMGLSLSIVGYIPILALSWITPKAAPFGALVKLKRFGELNAAFARVLRQSFGLALVLAVACIGGIGFIQTRFPHIGARMEPTGIFAVLIVAAMGTLVTQGLAIYLRSFKREPYLAQSIAVASLSLIVALLATARWGDVAIAAIYLLFTGIIGSGWAIRIFLRSRHSILATTPAAPEKDVAVAVPAHPRAIAADARSR